MVTVYSPLTWGIYDEPPPDIPECGFVGELCPPPTRGQFLFDDRRSLLYALSSSSTRWELCVVRLL